MHTFMSQWRLERHLLPTCKLPVLNTVQKLIITIRRCDWDWGNPGLVLDARRGFLDYEYENANTVPVDTGVVTWDPKGWGSALRHLKGLKEFQLQPECRGEDEDKLEETVTKARTWEFPCHDLNYAFSSEGMVVESWT